MEIFFGLLFVLGVFIIGVSAGICATLWWERPLLDDLLAETERQRRELDRFMADTRRELENLAAVARDEGEG